MVLGSGPIVIGQACEFDYSGNQAVRALKEEGYQVVLVNPNPASFMTTPGLADSVYVDPLEPEFLEAIIRREAPDALLPTMGGQTALNVARTLHHQGILSRYGVELIGAGIDAIEAAEDRLRFKEICQSIGLDVARSALVSHVSEARDFLTQTRLPLIIRPSYTLGGKGGSIAYTEEELEGLVSRALEESPIHTALLEESLLGWQEFELEVMRDSQDNAVVVCSIENIDPMGVHTGDSITVAPIQTLPDREYQKMRTDSLEVLRAVGVDCGGSNVQFALDPESRRQVVIEMNPRVSRSSALASKATGFPIARCAARLAVGFSLDEVINDITGKTVSCFEPALDYCAVKVPRFETDKFQERHGSLGTQMKSVGESLAIGRSFLEALNKAIRAGEFGFEGLEPLDLVSSAVDAIIDSLHPRRIFAIYTELLEKGAPAIEGLAARTGYHPWVLEQMARQAEVERTLEEEGRRLAGASGGAAGTENPDLLMEAKRLGYSDLRLASLFGVNVREIEEMRKERKIRRGYHIVDTCAGEFEAETPYFYSTFGEIDEFAGLGDQSVVIVGSGPNRIGQGLEFDTCCTMASLSFRDRGTPSIMVNSNPETVSTDFNVSRRLYLEPVTFEEVQEVLEKEGTKKVVVQLGGQTALNMAKRLEEQGAEILGTPLDAILGAEDRSLFTDMVATLGLKQPANRVARSVEDAIRSVEEIGFPVLLRPSFVLGGRSMAVVYTRDELTAFLNRGILVTPESPVLVDQFLEDAFEYDVDALCDGENVYIAGILQHIEAAGVHSGDSAAVFPPYKGDAEALMRIREATATIARRLGIRGFLNLQFAVKGSDVYVLEVNPRASRTVPFLAKSSGVDLVNLAVGIWSGESLADQGVMNEEAPGLPGVCEGRCIFGWAVKEAVFSFDRFTAVDPILGPEMRSTGESIGLGKSFGEAFAKATLSAGSTLPTRGSVFVSVHDADKETILPVVRSLSDMGFHIAATRGTADFLFRNGMFPDVILKIHEGHPNIVDHLKEGKVALVINTPLGRYTQKDDDYLRIEAIKAKVPYTTTTSAAEAALEGIRYFRNQSADPQVLPDSLRFGLSNLLS
jgi:carbamoyl-phosphate synthase large subunit